MTRTTKKSTVKLRSKATLPSRTVGRYRRSNLSGGSVAVYIASASIKTMPVGDHERENAWIQLSIKRPMSKSK